MTIRTNPPGAVVYVDDYEIGTTPISTNFVYYGTRKIRIAKDGYETLTVEQPIPAPWYQIPPLDFISETLVPGEIRDQRTLNYQLVPQRVVPPDELRARAEDLRIRSRTPGVVPAGAESVSPFPGAVASPPAGAFPPGSAPAYGPVPPQFSPAGSQPALPPAGVPPAFAPQYRGPQTLPPGGIPVR